MEADVADGGGVDEGHKLAHVIHEQAVEQVEVCALDAGEVEVLVDVGLTGVNHLHGASALGLEALHDVGEEAGEVLADALFGGEREAWMETVC